MIDFRIKGTKLPTIENGTIYRCVAWCNGSEHNNYRGSNGSCVSFGTKTFKGKKYILAERKEYTGTDYYMFLIEEIERLAKKQGMKGKTENMSIAVKKSDLKKIHDVACSTWKAKIEKLANRNTFGDTVELTQSEIDKMFKASDDKQTKVLEEVFGKQQKELDFRSSTIDFGVDGIKVFGEKELRAEESFIGLPRLGPSKNSFFLNPNYKWVLEYNELICTRK